MLEDLPSSSRLESKGLKKEKMLESIAIAGLPYLYLFSCQFSN